MDEGLLLEYLPFLLEDPLRDKYRIINICLSVFEFCFVDGMWMNYFTWKYGSI
jgi:hypothetical protein